MSEWLSCDRVAITGATGFLGGHLTRRLVKVGQRPILWARTPRETSLLAGLGPQLCWRAVDLTSAKDVNLALSETRPEVLFHLAGTRGRQPGTSAVRECLDHNVCATVHLLAAAQQAGVRRIVLLSSADVFGDQPGPHAEDLPLQPVSAYGIASAASAWFAQALYRESGCPVVVLRVFTAYGPGQPKDMFLSQAIDCAVHNRPFSMTAGLQGRDFIFVEDVVEALLAAAGRDGIEGQIVHIGAGQSYPLRAVARMIWDLTGSQGSLEIGARPAGPAETHDTWADIRLARTRLNWEPRTDLKTGLERTIAWQRDQRES